MRILYGGGNQVLSKYIENAISLHEKADAIVISDKNGYVEYSKWHGNTYFECKEVVGKHILEIYPELTPDTSTILRVLKTGKPRIDDEQNIVNFKGERIHIISTTLPIKVNEEIIGTICASVFCGSDREIRREKISNQNKLYKLDDIITQNPEMKEIKKRILKVANNSSTVLIYGETGTGKELVAESIHTSSKRKDNVFISQNCAAIPNSLLESIFFGTEKGTYTGAENKKGLFELADKGTLFLDEINSMDLIMQAKLLKVLEEKKVRRLGGTRDIYVDVKIICAMNEEPLKVLRNGKIREDLFYRISVVKFMIPPLRERREDIMLLTNYFIEHYNKEMQMDIRGVSQLTQNIFETNNWYGNIRELKNTIENAFNTVDSDVITIKHVSEFLNYYKKNNDVEDCNIEWDNTSSLSNLVSDYEKKIITLVLNDSKNMADAAKKLKVSRQNLRYKIDKYNINYK